MVGARRDVCRRRGRIFCLTPAICFRREAFFLSEGNRFLVGAGWIYLSGPSDSFSEGGDLFVGTRRFFTATKQLPPNPPSFTFQTKIISIPDKSISPHPDKNMIGSRQKYFAPRQMLFGSRQKYFRFPTNICSISDKNISSPRQEYLMVSTKMFSIWWVGWCIMRACVHS